MPQEIPLDILFADEGNHLVVGCNKPLYLNDPANVWHLHEGVLHIFLIDTSGGAVASSRHYLFDVEPGELMFGMDLSELGDEMTLVAVGGVPDTSIYQMDQETLKKHSHKEEYAATIAEGVDSWITRLASVMAKPLPRKDSEKIVGGETGVISKGSIIIPKHGVIWLHLATGSEATTIRAPVDPDAFIPITRLNCLEVHTDAQFITVDTAGLFAIDPEWRCIEEYYKLIVLGISAKRDLLAMRETEILEHKTKIDRAMFEKTCTNLLSIIHPDISEYNKAASTSKEALFSACHFVGATMNIVMEAPKIDNTTSINDSLQLIARTSRVRTRMIKLQKAWWSADCGGIVAFVKGSKQPVALIPSSTSSYDMVDPMSGERTPVTSESAATLESAGYMFYRPLPNKILTLWDIGSYIMTSGVVPDFIRLIAIGIAGGLMGLLLPLFTGVIFNTIIPEARHGQLFQVAGALFAASIAGAMFSLTSSFATMRISGRVDVALQAAIWDRLLKLPVPFFKDFTAGDLAMRANRIQQIRQILSGTVMSTIMSTLFSTFNIALLFYYDAVLAMWAIGLVFIAVIFSTLMNIVFLKYQKMLTDMQSKLQGVVLQLISGISKLRVAGVELHAFSLWADKFSAQRTLGMRVARINNNAGVFYAAFSTLTSMVIFAKIGLFSETPMMTGTFMAFNAAFGNFTGAFMSLASILSSILSIIPFWNQLKPIMETIPETTEIKEHPGDLSGAITMEKLSFRYEANGPLILDTLSMDIKAGEYIGIVGPSGAGKSTFFRLLLGFEHLESGSINWDGRDMMALDILEIRRQIGVVLQSSQLMTGSILSNIIGISSLTVEDAWNAAEMAGFADDIRQMPMGMQTVVSEGAATLSGGQKQRLMIARAIVNRPRILLFDEATSALDNKTQATVIESLEKLHATRIVIAHRLSTIVNVDRIFVMGLKGTIEQVGTYDELSKQPGIFADLMERQKA